MEKREGETSMAFESRVNEEAIRLLGIKEIIGK
jgi:hypothetical protein